ncbi:DinB family protein [Flavihumibacter sp. UBA7668]|uniref:DinB family protein n=1 Tax=Flavihumibacter sp. UBA7668 TaxID=1946542 RepID=UPI0025C5E741|nr:DinB family protein [Flavihumibacter sp. UBA7668]
MTAAVFLGDFAKFNHWANTSMVNWLQELDPVLAEQPFNAGFGSIAVTLEHIADAQLNWLQTLSGNIPNVEREISTDSSLQRNCIRLLRGSQLLVEYVAGITEQELYTTIGSDDHLDTRFNFLVHVINHSTYHRGQIVLLTRLLGQTLEISPTDFDAYNWVVREASDRCWRGVRQVLERS